MKHGHGESVKDKCEVFLPTHTVIYSEENVIVVIVVITVLFGLKTSVVGPTELAGRDLSLCQHRGNGILCMHIFSLFAANMLTCRVGAAKQK
jgi:hypothetical protein